MTHSSGITVSQELEKAFGEARSNNNVRWMRIEITLNKEPEQLVCTEKKDLGEFKEDFESLREQLKPKEPCYLIFRKDEKNDQEELGFQWLFVSYVPDGSPVRARMLYASSRDNLKKGLGYSYFTQEMHVSEKSEITQESLKNLSTPKAVLYSATELQVQQENKLAIAEKASSITSGDNVSVKFPLSDEAKEKLKALGEGSINYVRISLDIAKETVELGDSGSFETNQLPSQVPEDQPSYNLYRWKHNHDGTDYDQIVFVYCCPSGVKVKARMLYSTVKTTVVNYASANDAKPEQKIEIDGGNEWTEELMISYLHPKKASAKKKISRPKRPGKGGRRLIRRNRNK